MRVTNESYQDLIRRTLEGIKDALVREMDAGKFNASGRTKASFEVYAEEYYGALTGLRSFQTLVAQRITDGGKGRGPTINDGDGALYRSILQWLNDKGIQPTTGTIEEMARNISNKIHKKGTRIYRNQRQGIDLIGIAESFLDSMRKEIPSIVLSNLKQKIDASDINATT